MERRNPLLSAEEVDALLGSRPQTVSQALEAVPGTAHMRDTRPGWSSRASGAALDRGAAGSTGMIRRLLAEALHGAADAIYPSRGR